MSEKHQQQVAIAVTTASSPDLSISDTTQSSSSSLIHTTTEPNTPQPISEKQPPTTTTITHTHLLQKWPSHLSQGHDLALPIEAPIPRPSSTSPETIPTSSSTNRNGGNDPPDSIYNRIPDHRKKIIVTLLSFCSFLAPISSTTVLSATPEVAATFGTTGTIINLSNAFYMLGMGVSPCFWGPLSQVYGRRVISLISGFLFFACSVGTALSPDLATFYVFRILTAFEGTSFLILGASCIGDMYRPTERGTAMGWFLSGTLIGPAFGPFIGGIIVTFRTWRDIFWLQSALAGVATLALYLLLPETIHYRKADELKSLPRSEKAKKLWAMINPWRVVVLLRYPNLIAAGIGSGAIVWNMYSLLSPIRYILNPRFNLTSPIQSGLFYLAPGAGYLVGSFLGGRHADHVVKKYIKKRGERIPEDRLRSCLPFLGGVIPGCMLVYGWSVEKAVGGIPLPVLMMFLQGVAQLCSFPSLNTYCLDVMQSQSGEVIAGNYMMRYLFAALGTAIVLPATESIGVGWFSTISAGFLCVAALFVYATVLWGHQYRQYRNKINASKKKDREAIRENERSEVDVGNGVLTPGAPETNV